MSVNFDEAVFLWDEFGPITDRRISRVHVKRTGVENPFERSFQKSDGKCTAGWPDRAAKVFGYFFSIGFSDKEAEIEALKKFIEVDNMPDWLKVFITGWIRAKGYLMEDHALSVFASDVIDDHESEDWIEHNM